MNAQTKKIIENNLSCPVKGKTIDLTNEKLSISDYQWLAKLLEESSFVETINLPEISKDTAESILLIFDNATIKNSTITTLALNLSSFKNEIPENIALINQRIQSRLQRNKKHIFFIHGGGNIGLGLMADVISKSPYEYDIVATSNNQLTRDLVNARNQLWLKHNSQIPNSTTHVKGVRMISRKKNNIIQLYSDACLAAICVTQAVMVDISNEIAEAIVKRYEIDGSGLKILVLMNIPNATQFFYDKIYSSMLQITKDEVYTKKILAGISFVPTVIDRIVTPIELQEILSQLKSQLIELDENIDDIFLSSKSLNIAVSKLNLKFNLFNAEFNFSMYVPNTFPEARRLPALQVTSDLDRLETIKNKYINGPHAILAWLGALFGFSTISQSINYPYIYDVIKSMIDNEIAPILRAEYPEISENEWERLEKSFFERCLCSTEDLVQRVGRDPLRKLNAGGRIRGTIELAAKHNLTVSTYGLEKGIAAGILYALLGRDPTNPGCKKILEIYKSNGSSFENVLCYTGPAPSGYFTGFNPNKDRILIDRVLSAINLLHRRISEQQQMQNLGSKQVIQMSRTSNLTLNRNVVANHYSSRHHIWQSNKFDENHQNLTAPTSASRK